MGRPKSEWIPKVFIICQSTEEKFRQGQETTAMEMIQYAKKQGLVYERRHKDTLVILNQHLHPIIIASII